MSMPALFKGRLSIPVIGSPLFIMSVPDLVIAQCKAGVVGSFPALNARPASLLDEWIARIKEELAATTRRIRTRPSEPFAVNQIVHKSNNRLDHDLAVCEKYKVPMLITSLGAREELNQAAHDWGGIVFHDVINQKFAHKAVEKGADGLVLVAAGAGGQAGTISPLAFVAETRALVRWADRAVGRHRQRPRHPRGAACSAPTSPISARLSSRPEEANAVEGYKEMITSSSAEDIVYSNLFTGVHGNYLKPSIVKAGLQSRGTADLRSLQDEFWHRCLRRARKPKAWKEIWGSWPGDRRHRQRLPAAELIGRFRKEYDEAVDPHCKASCGARARRGTRRRIDRWRPDRI